MRKPQIEPQLESQFDDPRLTQLDQRRMHMQAHAAFHASLSREIRKGFERADEFRAAIGIAGVIDRIHPDNDVRSLEHFRPSQSIRKKHGIARRNISHRDSRRHGGFIAALGHRNLIRSQGASAKHPQIHLHCQVLFDTHRLRHPPRGFEFNGMPLPVIETKSISLKAPLLRPGETNGRIQTTAQQTDCFLHSTSNQSVRIKPSKGATSSDASAECKLL